MCHEMLPSNYFTWDNSIILIVKFRKMRWQFSAGHFSTAITRLQLLYILISLSLTDMAAKLSLDKFTNGCKIKLQIKIQITSFQDLPFIFLNMIFHWLNIWQCEGQWLKKYINTINMKLWGYAGHQGYAVHRATVTTVLQAFVFEVHISNILQQKLCLLITYVRNIWFIQLIPQLPKMIRY